MFNLIANNCVGSAIYVELNEKFNNPFTWGFIDADNFIKLIENYDNINFNNYKIINCDLDPEYKDAYTVVIDNTIKYHYIHYIHDDRFDKPKKKAELIGKHNRDLLGKYMEEYSNEKYNTRKDRMLAENKEPLFLVTLSKFCPTNRIKDIIKAKTKYKIIFLVNDDYKINNDEIPDNVEILYNVEKERWTPQKARLILKKSQFIKNILQ